MMNVLAKSVSQRISFSIDLARLAMIKPRQFGMRKIDRT